MIYIRNCTFKITTRDEIAWCGVIRDDCSILSFHIRIVYLLCSSTCSSFLFFFLFYMKYDWIIVKSSTKTVVVHWIWKKIFRRRRFFTSRYCFRRIRHSDRRSWLETFVLLINFPMVLWLAYFSFLFVLPSVIHINDIRLNFRVQIKSFHKWFFFRI